MGPLNNKKENNPFMASVDSVLDRVRTLQDARFRLTTQTTKNDPQHEDELARLSARIGVCASQVDMVKKNCLAGQQSKEMSRRNSLGECDKRLHSMVTWLRDGDVSKKPYSNSSEPMVSWHYHFLPVAGTTLTEWKDFSWFDVLRLHPGDGTPLAVVYKGQAAVSIPPGGMLTGSATVPLLGRTVLLLFQFPPGVPMVGTLLARRAEPPAPGMTFVACNGKNVVHGVFHGGRWITTEGMTLPEGGGPILVVYQYDLADTLRLRYLQADGKAVSVAVGGGAPPPSLLPTEVPVSLTLGGYRNTEGGAVITDRGGPLLLHVLQVYPPLSDAEMVVVYFKAGMDWSPR